jgi:predicted ATPase
MTIPEAARAIADEEMKKGRKNEEIKSDMLNFQRKVLERKIKTEESLSREKVVFFDRGIPDSIAYYEYYNFDTSEVVKLCKDRPYGKVFLLERLPFQKDYARIENDQIAGKIQELLQKAYANLGHEVTMIPVMSAQERVKMILSKLQ